MPGKLFEYLATGLPVFGVGPANGDAAALLNSSGAGEMVEGSDTERIKAKVMEYFSQWKKGDLKISKHDVTRYSRRSITKELIELF